MRKTTILLESLYQARSSLETAIAFSEAKLTQVGLQQAATLRSILADVERCIEAEKDEAPR